MSDRVAREQLLAALAAVHRAARVQRVAVRARAGGAAAVDARELLDRAERRVDLLQSRGLARQQVEPEMVADRHLVGEPAQVPLQRGELARELLAARVELARAERTVAARGQRGGDGDLVEAAAAEAHQPIVVASESPP